MVRSREPQPLHPLRGNLVVDQREVGVDWLYNSSIAAGVVDILELPVRVSVEIVSNKVLGLEGQILDTSPFVVNLLPLGHLVGDRVESEHRCRNHCCCSS